MNTLFNITLFVVVMMLTIAFIQKATAAEVQDTENTCAVNNTCKPAGEIDNPFGE